MKVHPAPAPAPNTALLRYDVASSANPNPFRQKTLRRLPHIFAKVLELPFRSDADVSVEDTPAFLRFTVPHTDAPLDVRAHALRILPGLTKIVVRPASHPARGDDFGLDLDLWRFRLPPSTMPTLAVASCFEGDLVVTVPKGGGGDDEDQFVDGFGAAWGDLNLVLVH